MNNKKIIVSSVASLLDYLMLKYESEDNPMLKLEWFQVNSEIVALIYRDELVAA